MAINEYDEILTTGKVSSARNEYLDLIDSDKSSQKQALQTSMYNARGLAPDRSADVIRIAKKNKLPSEFVARNYDELKKQESDKEDFSGLVTDSPAVSRYLSNPQNAAVSRDDIPVLSKIETAVGAVKRQSYDLKNAAMTGWNNLNSTAWHLGAAYGLTDLDTAANEIAAANKRAQDIQSKMPDYAKDFNSVMAKQKQDVDKALGHFSEGYKHQKDWHIRQALLDYGSGVIGTVGEALDMIGSAFVRPRGLAYSTVENLANSLPSLITGFAGARTGAMAGAGIAVVAGQAGPQALTPEEIVTVPVGAVLGGAIGFVGGSFAGQTPVEIGSWINEQLQTKGYDVTNSADIKKAYSNPQMMADLRSEAERKGLTTSAVDSIFNVFAGRLASVESKGVIRGALHTGADVAVQAAGETASEYAGQVAAKKGTKGTSFGEAVQEGITSLGHSFGETVIGAGVHGADMSVPIKKAAGSIREKFHKNPVKAVEEVVSEVQNATQAQKDAVAMSEIGQAIRESKTHQRNPDAIKEIIDTATQGDEATSVYFQTTDWDKYWTAKGDSPAAKASEIMGDDGVAYYQAKNTGEPLIVPLSDYVSKVAPTDDFDGLLSSARTKVDGMSLSEAQDFLRELPETMDTLASEATQHEDALQSAGDTIAQNISGQLVASGFEKSTAETYGQLYKSTFTTLATRTGLSADELFNKFNLKIMRSDSPESIAINEAKKEKELTIRIKGNIRSELESSSPIKQFKKALGKKSVYVSPENWNDWKPVIDKIGKQYFTKDRSKGSLPIDTFAQEFGSIQTGNEYTEQELFSILDGAQNVTDATINQEVEKRIKDEADYAAYLKSEDVAGLLEGISRDQITQLLSDKKQRKELVQTINAVEPDLKVTDEEVLNELRKLSNSIDQADQASTGETSLFQQDQVVNAPSILFQEVQSFGNKVKNFFQKNQDKRGAFRFGNGNFNIDLFKKADLSTFLHESGHFYLEVLGDLVDTGIANDQIKEDYATLLNWFGVEYRDQIGTKHHERFARAFEAYLLEGKAPSQGLRESFARFRAWLLAIYRSVRNLDISINKEIRGVFDRLVATDEEISVAQDEGNISPIFTTAESAGMTPDEFRLYEETVRDASQKAQEVLQQKVMKQYQREYESWWKDRKSEVRQEVVTEINQNKDYTALSVLQKGALPDGSALPEGMPEIKISTATLESAYDKEFVSSLPRGITTKGENGIHQDLAANILGYSSGDELLNAISKLVSYKQAIETTTDARMRLQYGDKLIDGTLAEDARRAVYNDEQQKVILAELKALRKKQMEVRPFQRAEEEKLRQSQKEREYELRWIEAENKLKMAIQEGRAQAEIEALRNAAKQARQAQAQGIKSVNEAIPTIDSVRKTAETIIQSKRVRDISPYDYYIMARKASKLAFDSVAKGDYTTAATAKQHELMAIELYLQANQVKDVINSTVEYLSKFSKKDVRERIAKAGIDYLDQIDSFLDRFDFAKGISLTRIDKRKSLAAWVESQREQGLDPVIPDELMNEAYTKHYKDMTIEELAGVRDSIKNIESFARLKNKLLKAAKQRAFDEVVDDAVSSIEASAKKTIKEGQETRLPKDKLKRFLDGALAAHRKFASLIREMDGFQDGGTMWEILIRPMNDAGNNEAVMTADATEKMSQLFSVYSQIERVKMYKTEFIPDIKDSLSKWGRIAVALNWGNMDSRQKVMDGRQWTQGQVEAILNGLDERDWKFVQSVWNFVNSYWPEIKSLSERVNGVAPEKVEAEPVQTKFGAFSGGYYPIKYDDILSDKSFSLSAKEAADMMMRGAFVSSTTKSGHRKSRVQGVKMPVRLDMDVLMEHMSQVIHDITHYEFLIDTNKILRDERIRSAIKDHYGDPVYKELIKSVTDIAAGVVPAQNAIESGFNYLRSGATVAGLGFNLMTSLQQPFQITNSFVRVGPKWVMKGIVQWLGDTAKMQNTFEDIKGKSEFMRLRGQTMMREISEIRNSLRIRGALSPIEDGYFYLIQKAQLIADIPTWLGAYEKAFGTDINMTEEKAIALADQAVIDSQGNGQVKDLARVQRGSPLFKLWTNFYSFYNTLYNLTAESIKKTDFKSPSSVGVFAADMLMLYTVPALISIALRNAIRGKNDDEELWEELAKEQSTMLLGTMVGLREFGGALQGYYGYEGPAGARFFSEASNLIRQVSQGESDTALWRSINNTAGILLHYPSGQVDRTTRAMIQIQNGDETNYFTLLTGPKRK